MNYSGIKTFISALGLTLASSLTTQAAEYVHNTNFSHGIQGWTALNGGDCLSWNKTEGADAKGAMQVVNKEANPESVWDTQVWCEFTTPLQEGPVTISYAIKCVSGTGTMRCSTSEVGHYQADQSISNSFKNITWSFTAKGGETGLCFDLGAVANTYIIDDVHVVAGSSGNGCTPDLHVEGNQMKDPQGNTVVLHGVMDTPSMWFNSNRWSGGYNDNGVVNAIAYFNKIFDAITDNAQGAYCNVFRLHMEPAWLRKDKADSSTESNLASTYDRDKVKYYLEKLFIPIAKNANAHGLYVIMRPPGVCPGDIQVGDEYQKYLLDVWDIVSSNAEVKANSGWLSIELANEPIRVKDQYGNRSTTTDWGPANGPAKTDFFQPIINKIRSNGFKGIVWVPGEGYQSSYESYALYPISDSNYGFAVHVYPGWYGNDDNKYSGESFISNFESQVPGVTSKPVVVTEIDWSPGSIKYDENGQPVKKYDGNYETVNYGTWGTASTSKWGNAYKAMKDHFGNISMTLTSTDDYVDMETFLKTGKVQASFLDKQYPDEACGVACFNWYKEYSTVNVPSCDDGYVTVKLNSQSDKALTTDELSFKATVNSGRAISNVAFYDNYDLIEKISGAPYNVSLNLTKGKHVIKAYATDVMGLRAVDSVTIVVNMPQGPFNGVAHNIPGKIEVEDFDEGGEGFAYHDSDEENHENSTYREGEGVDVKTDEMLGTRIGWTSTGEWLEYTVNVAKTAIYTWKMNVSTDNDNASFHFLLDDEDITEIVNVPSTGDWNTLAEIKGTTTELKEGKHILKLYIDNQYFDIDWFSFEEISSTEVKDIRDVPTGDYEVLNLLGQKIGQLSVNGTENSQLQSFVNQPVLLKPETGNKVYKVIVR